MKSSMMSRKVHLLSHVSSWTSRQSLRLSPRQRCHDAASLIVRSSRRGFVQPRAFPNSGYPKLPKNERFEEERFVGYKAHHFYPVHLGEIFRSRYQVIGKLGFGTASTVWLCRDLHQDVLVTAKVCISGEKDNQELIISQHIKGVEGEHFGRQYVRVSVDDFLLEGSHGRHQCLIFPPLGLSLTQLRDLFEDRSLEKTLLQRFLLVVLTALDFLHQVGIVHTDLSPNNILVGVEADTAAQVELAEIATPSPRKVLDDRTIHLSYRMPTSYEAPSIIDFGAAHPGNPGQKFSGDVMPGVFRAPEVIAGMEWDSKIDIWSVGVMIWNLFEDGNLFQPVKDGHFNDELHFAQMISLMGPPPKQFLERSDKCRQYWDVDGTWIAATPIPSQTLESREMRLEGEDKHLLLALMRKILRWLPEERPSARELYTDDFLNQFLAPQREGRSATASAEQT